MYTRHKNRLMLMVLAMTLIFSLLNFEVVRAEGEVPEEPPVVTQPEPDSQETQDLAPETGNTDPIKGENPDLTITTATEPADLIVLDTQGSPVPLASTAALEALLDPDPYFFKNGVKYEFAASDCDPSEDVVLACDNPIQAALDYLAAKSWVPDNNKVYIEAGNFDTSSEVPGITLNGSSWLKGAPGLLIIAGSGSGNDVMEDTIITGNFTISNMKSLTLSGFSLIGGLLLTDNIGSLTLNDITVTGSTSDGIKVENHTGSVKLEKVTVTENDEDGAEIQATGSVQVLDSSFSRNDASGLVTITPGNILLNKVSADDNLNGDGLNLNNLSGTGTVRILNTLGINSASGNTAGHGILANSRNLIVINGLTATGNESGGANLDNKTGTAGIIIYNSRFDGSTAGAGAEVLTSGSIRLEGVSASGNLAGTGINLDNTSGLGSVTILKGQFNNNQGNGLVIRTKSAVILNQVGASANTLMGADINNDGTLVRNVQLLSTFGENMFNLNGDTGLKIVTHGSVTLNNVTAIMNMLSGVPDTEPDERYLHGGVLIDNTSGTACVRIVGANISYNSGNFTIGLNVDTNGAVYLRSLTASNNHWGADINNLGSLDISKGISIIQSTFNNNANAGIIATTFGNIIVNNINAIGNQGPRAVGLQNVVGSSVGVSLLSTLGENLFLNNAGIGLEITTAGSVILSKVSASNNGAIGANLPNQIQGVGNVRVTDSVFDNNGDTGLIIQTEGAISLVSVSASSNGGTDNSNGAYLGGGARSVSVVKSKFNGNTGTGLVVIASGSITLNSILANDNAHAIPNADPDLAGQFSGIFLQNSCIDCTSGVTIKNSYYNNEFNRNTNISLIDTLTTAPQGVGINIRTYGPLVIRGASASDNGQHGAYLLNNDSTINNVSIFNSQFESNRLTGLWVQTLGNITLSNVIAGNSSMQTGILYVTDPYPSYSGSGAYLANVADFTGYKYVTVLSSRFDNNYGVGLRIISNGAIRLVNVTASNNVTSAAADPYGAYISNFGSPPEVSAGISISGTSLLANQFNNNVLADGLFIRTTGRLVLNNIAASGNGVNGIYYNNTANTNTTSVNTIVANNNQFAGLFIVSKGQVTGYSIIANHNGAGINQAAAGMPFTFLGAASVYISNTSSTTGTAGVVISRSQFNENLSTGLRVYSNGNITVNNIQAVGNRTADPAPPSNLRIDGAYLQNTSSTFAVSIRVLSSLGSNRFDNNRDYGLHILARQNITISKATANANGILDPAAVRSGMNLVVTAPASVISFSCVGVTSNGLHGIWVEYRAVGGTGKLVLLNSYIGGNSVSAPGQDIYIDPAYSSPTIIQSGAYCSGW